MNHNIYTYICSYFVNEAASLIDTTHFNEEYLKTDEFGGIALYATRQKPQFMKVFNTITGFHLTESDCKDLMYSSQERYPDEELLNYRNRLKTKAQFNKYGKQIFAIVSPNNLGDKT